MSTRQRESSRARVVEACSGLLPALLAIAGFGLLAGCSFDASRLDELRADSGGPDGVGPDLAGDGGPDFDVLDGGPDGADVVQDLPGDTATDPREDVEVGDGGTDAADLPVDAVADGDGGLDVVDVAEDADAEPDVEAPNQPPVLTVPGTQHLQGYLSLEVPGVMLDDPDVGTGNLELTVEATNGLATFDVIPVGLAFTTGDGVDDPTIEVTGTLGDLNAALDALVFRATTDGPAAGSLQLTVSDLGNTGTGGPLTDAESIQIELEARVFDFAVQRGYTVIASGETEATITAGVDYDAPTGPAFVRLVNTRLSGMGKTSGGGQHEPDRWMAVVAAKSDLATSVTFQRTTTDDDDRLAWEIVEYTGEAGGPNAFTLVDRGVVAFTGGNEDLVASVEAPAEVVDDEDIVVFITGQRTDSNHAGDTNLGEFTADWDADMDEAVFERGEGGETGQVSYAVVRFGGSNWSVQRLEHTFTTNSGSEPQELDSSVDPARTLLHVQSRSSSGNNVDVGATAWVSTANALRFELSPSASVDATTTVAWVIANAQEGNGAMRVEHLSGSRSNIGASEEDIWTVTLADPLPYLSWGSVMGECARVIGSGSNPPRGSIVLLLDDEQTVELRQSERDNDKVYRFSVVHWPDDP